MANYFCISFFQLGLLQYYSVLVSGVQHNVRQSWTSQRGHPNTSSAHLGLYIVITLLLTVFPMLYFMSLWLFYNSHMVLPNPFTFFNPPTKPAPFCQLSVCSLYLWVCFYFVCLLCSLDSTYKWNHMIFVFIWLILFSIIPSRSIHVVNTIHWIEDIYQWHIQ